MLSLTDSFGILTGPESTGHTRPSGGVCCVLPAIAAPRPAANLSPTLFSFPAASPYVNPLPFTRGIHQIQAPDNRNRFAIIATSAPDAAPVLHWHKPSENPSLSLLRLSLSLCAPSFYGRAQ